MTEEELTKELLSRLVDNNNRRILYMDIASDMTPETEEMLRRIREQLKEPKYRLVCDGCEVLELVDTPYKKVCYDANGDMVEEK